MNFFYKGILKGSLSWSHVGREICSALSELGCNVAIRSSNGSPTETKIQQLIKNQPGENCINVSYTIPPNATKFLNGEKNFLIYNYETTILPENWVELINNHPNLILLPSSNFAKNIFVSNGVRESIVKVVPHGIDRREFHPQVKPLGTNIPKDYFVFLTIGSPHVRKGFDVLIQAFVEEFASTKKVCLIVKSRKHVNKAHYEIDLLNYIKDMRSKVRMPPIIIILGHIDNMASLYNLCDCFVLPSRSECFSLTPLEALACRKPVITTRYGGHLDYLNDKNSYLIDYKVIKASKAMQYWHYDPKAEIAEPAKNHLKKLMRRVYKERQEAQHKAQAGFEEVVPQYTWKKAAQQMITIAEEAGWGTF